MLTSIECVFLDFWDARGLGLLFVIYACAVGLCGNRLTSMRGTWGVVWRSAHVPTIPFTWLRRANALDPTTHAFNYQALLSIKTMPRMWIQLLCACVLYSYGSRGLKQWLWRHKSHMGEMRDSDWSRPKILRSDWLPIIGAIMTTGQPTSKVSILKMKQQQHDINLRRTRKKIRVPDGIWTHDPPWSSRML